MTARFCIHLIIYMIIYYALTWEMCYRFRISETNPIYNVYGNQDERLAIVALGFVLSRVLSGIAVCIFKQAKDDGMCADTKKNMGKLNLWILLAGLIAIVIIFSQINFYYAVMALAFAGLLFAYYAFLLQKKFGGISGDLAGWFLQNCELLVLLAVVIL